jgi:hypothetical protein
VEAVEASATGGNHLARELNPKGMRESVSPSFIGRSCRPVP